MPVLRLSAIRENPVFRGPGFFIDGFGVEPGREATDATKGVA